MAEHSVGVDISGEVARLTLARPERHNAFDDHLIAELSGALAAIAENRQVRVLFLAAEGKSFSSGADLGWMKRAAGYSEAENREDALRLGRLLQRLDTMPQATIALVQGPAYGGGVGLVAACDIAVAVESAAFSLSEVRLGLIPAVISPYLVRAMGERAARRYVLTAERIDCAEAHRIGLVHQVVADAEALEAAAARLAATFHAVAPGAVAEAKKLIRFVSAGPVDDAMIAKTAAWIARLRAAPEGGEGLTAFLEKRKPTWAE